MPCKPDDLSSIPRAHVKSRMCRLTAVIPALLQRAKRQRQKNHLEPWRPARMENAEQLKKETLP